MKSLGRPRRQRTLRIIGTISFIVLSAALYGALNFWYWQDYKGRVDQIDANGKNFRQVVLRKESRSPSEQVTAINTASQKLAGSTDECQITWWAGYRANILARWEEKDRCLKLQEAHAASKKAAERVISFAESETKLVEALKPITTADKAALTDKTWPKRIQTWREVQSTVDSLAVGTDYEPVKLAARTRLTAALKAWENLEKADSKKDKADFIAAYDAVDRAITDMKSITGANEAALKPLIAELEAESSKL